MTAKAKKEPKAGWRTSEFWTGLVATLGGLAVASGWITPVDASALSGAAGKIIGGIVAAVGVVAYIKGRNQVKVGK